nr:MAG TPA: DNA-binding protein [Caudoviricetes sp.]DAZ64564.1 MAG TPA: DNA-binding protein [Caudoviricetes sp.]
MHTNRISFEEVAAEMGVTRAYISMILNGRRKPPDARKRVEGAIDAIIERRAEDKEDA